MDETRSIDVASASVMFRQFSEIAATQESSCGRNRNGSGDSNSYDSTTMNTLSTLTALGGNTTNVSCMRPRENPTQSVTKAMDNFLLAVQQMKDTVMVPSRLKDIKYESASKKSAKEEESLVPFAGGEQVEEPDLLLCYKMVDAVRNDLVCGPAPPPLETPPGSRTETPEPEEPDETRFAAFVRGQLQTLMGCLHNLTDMANFLTQKYKDEMPPEFN